MQTITKAIAKKVLETVDAGLSKGTGYPTPGAMCVEAAVCFAMGLPHGDDPACVSRALRGFKIGLNDSEWSSNAARAKGMRRLALAQLGSAGVLDDQEFVKRLSEFAIRVAVPIALRAAASLQKDMNHKSALLDAAIRCEAEGTQKAADSAAYSAYSAYSAASAAYSAYSAASAASAAYSAYSAYSAASVDSAVYSVRSAASAASVASVAASAASVRDKVLADFAEGVVQILIAMEAPGCKWLPLTEA